MNLNGVSVCPRQRVYVPLVQVHRDLRGLGIKLLKGHHRLDLYINIYIILSFNVEWTNVIMQRFPPQKTWNLWSWRCLLWRQVASCVWACSVCRRRGRFLVPLWQSFSQSVVYRGPDGLNEDNGSYILLIVLGLFGLILTDRRWDYSGLTLITTLPLLVLCFHWLTI